MGNQVAIQSLVTGERQVLIEDGGDAAYLPTGHLAYMANDTLVAVPFDAEQRTLSGGPVPLVEGVSVADFSAIGQFAYANDGTLVYQRVGELGETRTLVWVDRQGNEEPLAIEPRSYAGPRLSPDESRVAVAVQEPDNVDIWIYDLARGVPTRLTFDPALDLMPMWTPDGERIVFSSAREQALNLFWKRADGTGEVERLTTSPYLQTAYNFAPDGTTFVFVETVGERSFDIGTLATDGNGEPEMLLQTAFGESLPHISPDGRWMAYVSDESGEREVYIRPFPNVNDGRWQVSNGFA